MILLLGIWCSLLNKLIFGKKKHILKTMKNLFLLFSLLVIIPTTFSQSRPQKKRRAFEQHAPQLRKSNGLQKELKGLKTGLLIILLELIVCEQNMTQRQIGCLHSSTLHLSNFLKK